MCTELKIKSKSLAAEARMIRAEEIKVRDHARKRASLQKPTGKLNALRQRLYDHRIDVVRFEARATFLARSYISGKTRSVVEANKVTDARVRRRAMKIAAKYGPNYNEGEFLRWLDA